MPTLEWNGKSPGMPSPAQIRVESILYPRGAGYPDAEPRGRLFLGDNLPLMAALLPEYEGKLQLIYADPPFFSNRKYRARIGRGEDSRKPSEWKLAEGYGDSWDTLDAYLDFLYPRLLLMYRLLAPSGTLYLHLDWHANAYARVLLDEIFGADRLLNEIVWVYHGPSPIRSAFNRKHDTLLAYTKTKDYYFDADSVREPYHPNTVKTFASSPKAGFGKKPNLKRGKVPEDWWYFPVVARLHKERTGYPTQKPEALLERILLASSREGDWVADFFCGSGTLPAVAARLGRHFLASDASWRAIHTTRSRVAAQAAYPFTLERDTAAAFPLQESRLEFSLEGRTIRLPKSALESLDYWEVDPSGEGEIFRSAAQARRAPRSSHPPEVLTLPRETAPRGKIRWVTIEGEQFQQEIGRG
jgi:DNA modification methylase